MEAVKAALLNGRYSVVTNLNHGSYGMVYLVKDILDSDKLYAVKSIAKSQRWPAHHSVESPGSIGNDSQSNTMVDSDEASQEIGIHSILGSDHKYIAKFLNSFETDTHTYLVMDYYPAGDLYEAIRADRGPRDHDSIMDFMLQLIDAVEYAHSKGIYHRDIKPENILLDSDGSVRLADWGLATVDRISKEFGVGSERYMAPELFDKENLAEYDSAKADIWSLGICLLNILFGRNPFTIATQQDKLFLDFASNREALFDIFPTLSSDTFAVLRHALTLDPANRSLEKIKSELKQLQVWTTDEEFVDDGYMLSRAASLEFDETDTEILVPPTIGQQPITANNQPEDPIIIATAGRKPLRTPSYMSTEVSESLKRSHWDRTMQFTPPKRFLSPVTDLLEMQSVDEEPNNKTNYKVKGRPASSRMHEFSSSKSRSLVPSTMESVSEEDEELAVFEMDHSDILTGTGLSRMDLRDSSGSDSSLYSVPSLVQSQNNISTAVPKYIPPYARKSDYGVNTSAYSSSMSQLSFMKHDTRPSSSSFNPNNSISRTTAKPVAINNKRNNYLETMPSEHVIASSVPSNPRDIMKFGKSWSDLVFEDDDDDDLEDDAFYAFIRQTLPPAHPQTSSSISKAVNNKTGPPAILATSGSSDNWVMPAWQV